MLKTYVSCLPRFRVVLVFFFAFGFTYFQKPRSKAKFLQCRILTPGFPCSSINSVCIRTPKWKNRKASWINTDPVHSRPHPPSSLSVGVNDPIKVQNLLGAAKYPKPREPLPILPKHEIADLGIRDHVFFLYDDVWIWESRFPVNKSDNFISWKWICIKQYLPIFPKVSVMITCQNFFFSL